ncbi:ABC1 family-domain-containing protein [Protomyces lactucae-debilis]|uniref:ABC1 family-domain-containing protein n=1 Tax=Protomyces lactucae-debilis TaxID=2754530 RepID=A0A1Y2FQM1_PROLT|nr:ABC1 family-domain-containing protein [Protomyces lactucae-debilis]ORY84995.1 ABC1 family-domain-containing protein [Protomyces lactucae-debilis]
MRWTLLALTVLTNEERLLEESEKEWDELYNQVPQDRSFLYKAYRSLAIPFRVWVFEPLATAFRFIHLVLIFTPVLVAIPIVFLGSIKAGSHDKSGAVLWYRFLVHQMELAGPTFIKLGQWAASRTDIFPDAMCELMSKLHSNVSAHPLWQTKRIIRKAFNGLRFEEIFEEFEEKPLGVGAIAQVYRAKLKANLLPDSKAASKHVKQKRRLTPLVVQTLPQSPPSGSVAIKVLHPRVEKTVHRDLRIMKFFARILNAIPTLEWFSFPDEVDQFSEMMRLQLDLRIEGNNLSKFQENFKSRSQVTFPFPYHEYTTRSVLIEEYAHGLPLQYFLDAGSAFNSDLADTGLDAFLHMLILDNFVHADLHPGNIMVRFFKPVTQPFLQQVSEIFHLNDAASQKRIHGIMHDDEATDLVVARMKPLRHDKAAWLAELAKVANEGFRPQLIFIDTGLVTELNTLNRRNFLDLFSAVASFDGHRAGTLMVERCRQSSAVLEPEIFALKMQHLVLNVKSQTFSLGKIRVGDILNTVLSMVRDHHVRMEGDFINVVLSILLLEGIGRQLNPDLDLFKSAIPFLREAGKQGVKQAAAGDTQEKLTWIKVWLGLELREMYVASTSAAQVEELVSHDVFSTNV